MADRLYYRIVLKRPSGELSEFRFAHVWDGEASWDGYPVAPVPSVAEDLITEGGDGILTEGSDQLTTE